MSVELRRKLDLRRENTFTQLSCQCSYIPFAILKYYFFKILVFQIVVGGFCE